MHMPLVRGTTKLLHILLLLSDNRDCRFQSRLLMHLIKVCLSLHFHIQLKFYHHISLKKQQAQ